MHADRGRPMKAKATVPFFPKPGFAPRVIEGSQQLDLEDAIRDAT